MKAAKGPGDDVPGGLTGSLPRRSADESTPGDINLFDLGRRFQWRQLPDVGFGRPAALDDTPIAPAFSRLINAGRIARVTLDGRLLDRVAFVRETRNGELRPENG
jgi:hypothetical protein